MRWRTPRTRRRGGPLVCRTRVIDERPGLHEFCRQAETTEAIPPSATDLLTIPSFFKPPDVPEDVVRDLRATAVSGSDSDRSLALRILGELRDEAAVPSLATALACDPDPRLRGVAAWSLARAGTPEAAKALRGALEVDETIVRLSAVQALGAFLDPADPPLFIARLEDEDERVRRSAVKSLGRYEDPALLEVLRPLLDDPELRADARVEIVGIGTREAGTALREAGVARLHRAVGAWMRMSRRARVRKRTRWPLRRVFHANAMTWVAYALTLALLAFALLDGSLIGGVLGFAPVWVLLTLTRWLVSTDRYELTMTDIGHASAEVVPALRPRAPHAVWLFRGLVTEMAIMVSPFLLLEWLLGGPGCFAGAGLAVHLMMARAMGREARRLGRYEQLTGTALWWQGTWDDERRRRVVRCPVSA